MASSATAPALAGTPATAAATAVVPESERDGLEAWTRAVLYRQPARCRAMQALKSRVMHGASYALCQAFVVLFMAVRADYRYSFSGPFRRASTGASLVTLLYGKAFGCAMLGCACLYVWFRRYLLRRDVVYAYAAARVADWALTAWLFLALVQDFGSSPFDLSSSLGGGQRLLYFSALALCMWSLANSYINLSRLRRTWHEYEPCAFSLYQEAVVKGVEAAPLAGAHGAGGFQAVSPVATPIPEFPGLPSAPPAPGSGQFQVSFDGAEVLPLADAAEYHPQQAEPSLYYSCPSDRSHGSYCHAGFSQGSLGLAGHGAGPYANQLAVFDSRPHWPQSEASSSFAGHGTSARSAMAFRPEPPARREHAFLDVYARIPRDEFELRWAAMPESGRFERAIAQVPSTERMGTHLHEQGFSLVNVDRTGGAGEVRMYAFAQSRGAVFLVEFLFLSHAPHLVTTFKSQDPAKTSEFISLLALQHVLGE